MSETQLDESILAILTLNSYNSDDAKFTAIFRLIRKQVYVGQKLISSKMGMDMELQMTLIPALPTLRPSIFSH